jgi:hypothetical protein
MVAKLFWKSRMTRSKSWLKNGVTHYSLGVLRLKFRPKNTSKTRSKSSWKNCLTFLRYFSIYLRNGVQHYTLRVVSPNIRPNIRMTRPKSLWENGLLFFRFFTKNLKNGVKHHTLGVLSPNFQQIRLKFRPNPRQNPPIPTGLKLFFHRVH